MSIHTKLLLHQNLHSLLLIRRLSTTILSPSNPSTILTSKQKSRAAIHLLKSETQPSRILDICRAAALNPSSHLDRIAFSCAVSKLSSSQSFSSIRSLVKSLLLSSQNPNFISHAIVLFGQAQMMEDAVQTFRSLPSSQSFNSLLFAGVISNNHPQVFKFFGEYPAMYGVVPDVQSFNLVIKSYAESGNTRSAYKVFDEMLLRKIKPNMTTFCNALAGFYREKRFEDVEKVLVLMKKHDCCPGVSTYNVRMLGLVNVGMVEKAKELFDEMMKKKVKPSWVSYGHLIVGFCKDGNLEEGKRFYKLMGRNGCVGESWVYFALMNYLCKGGDFDGALGVCRDTMVRNWIPCFASMKMLVNGLASGERLDEAKELVEKVKERFPNAVDMWKDVEEGLLK